MGTEVLRPQDCFIERIRAPPPSAAAFSRRRNFNYYPTATSSSNNNNNFSYSNYFPAVSSGKPSRKPVTRPEQRKRVERRPHSSSSDDSRVAARSAGVVLAEKVTILRRGESLDSKIKSEALRKEGGDLVVVGTQRIGPDPEMVPRRIRIADLVPGSDTYAGSAFAVSPAPSALPLPSFGKKQQPLPAVVVDDSATRDLRRLLRI